MIIIKMEMVLARLTLQESASLQVCDLSRDLLLSCVTSVPQFPE